LERISEATRYKVCKARTFAFEPDPATATVLRRNIIANDVGRLVEVCEIALGKFNGQIAFTVGLDTMNRVARSDDKPIQMVPVRRLDDIVDAAAPTLIKLDVEGFEEQVLRCASRVLASPCLLAVQSELRSAAVEDTLGSFGFEAIFYEPFERKIAPTTFGYRTTNTLFVRDIETVTRRLIQAPTRKVVGRDL
jgi:FkbM family methyltransferase